VAATCSRAATPGGAAAVSDGLVRSLRSSLSLRFLGLLFFLLFSGWSFLSSRSSSLFFFSLFLLSPSFYLFLSLSSVFSFSPSPRLFPSSMLLCWFLFIEPSEWLCTALIGSSRSVGHWARLPRLGPPPRFSGKCAVGGRPLCPVGGLQAREWPAKKFKQKLPFFLLPRCMFGGEEER